MGGMVIPIPEPTDLSEGFDRVLHTAGDRPNTDTLPALLGPAADHRDAELTRRREDIEEKHKRVCAFLDATGQDALVLGRGDSVAWFTSGGDLGHDLGSETSSVLIYV